MTRSRLVPRRRTWFSQSEESIHLQRVASVRIETGIIWSDLIVESTGGSDPITCHGHHKADARRIRDLVAAAQTAHLPAAAETGPTKACPFCAETIKQAAKVCRYCQRELPRAAPAPLGEAPGPTPAPPGTGPSPEPSTTASGNK